MYFNPSAPKISLSILSSSCYTFYFNPHSIQFNFPENVPTLDVEFEKSSEVAGSFSEIPVMRRRKSHALDSIKVDRYRTSI